jgi:hypothetical protein
MILSSISRANGAVKSTSIQSDGKIVIGGDFTFAMVSLEKYRND